MDCKGPRLLSQSQHSPLPEQLSPQAPAVFLYLHKPSCGTVQQSDKEGPTAQGVSCFCNFLVFVCDKEKCACFRWQERKKLRGAASIHAVSSEGHKRTVGEPLPPFPKAIREAQRHLCRAAATNALHLWPRHIHTEEAWCMKEPQRGTTGDRLPPVIYMP